jgi:hypothetical protein
MFLIVVCSPTSARSAYVNQELLTFKRLHGEARTLALIVGGRPAISPGKTLALETGTFAASGPVVVALGF